MKRHVALLMGLALLVLSTAAMPAAGAKRTWTAIAGGGTQDQSIVLNGFYPRTLEIAVGDTVTWQVFGFHNIAFPGGQQMPRLEMMDGDKVFIDPRVIVPAGGARFDGMGYHKSGLPHAEGERGRRSADGQPALRILDLPVPPPAAARCRGNDRDLDHAGLVRDP